MATSLPFARQPLLHKLLPTMLLIALSAFGTIGMAAEPAAMAKQIDAAMQAAGDYLVARQSADGAWRSEVYPPFRDGDALTPLVLRSLLSIDPSAKLETACQLGSKYLEAPVQPDGTIRPGPHGLNYPVYTAAGAVVVLSNPANADRRRARDAWLRYLRERQLTEALGWQPADTAYGGWGYSPDRPRKPQPGEPAAPLSDPNLSATVFALEALRAAGAKADDPAVRGGLAFVERCQNFSANSQKEPGSPATIARDSDFDDGGFFFMLDDAVRNKAGIAGHDWAARERYHSYGSTTADGLRALLLCGMATDSPRLIAARHWLEGRFSPDTQPGDYAKDREHARQSLYYYYAHSQALAWKALALRDNTLRKSIAPRAAALAGELIKRQQADGSWRNSAVDVREDDPLVATPLALEALAACRGLVGEK